MHLKIRSEAFTKTADRLQESFPSGLRHTNSKQVQSLPEVTERFNGGNIIISLLGVMAEPVKGDVSGKS